MNKILYCWRSLYISSFLIQVRLYLNCFYAFFPVGIIMKHWSVWEIYFNTMNIQGEIYFLRPKQSGFLFQVPCASCMNHLCSSQFLQERHLNMEKVLHYGDMLERGSISGKFDMRTEKYFPGPNPLHLWWMVAGRVCSRANRKHSTYRRTTELEQGQLPDCSQGMGQFGAESPVQVGNQHQIWLCIRFALHSHIPFLSSELLLWTPCGWFLWYS